MFFTLMFWSGLAYFAYQDATTASVSAQPFEFWCVQVYLLDSLTHPWWLPLLWYAGFTLLVKAQYLGSADAWLIAVLASRFDTMALLWVLLLACVSGITQALLFKQHQLPWLPHLGKHLITNRM